MKEPVPARRMAAAAVVAASIVVWCAQPAAGQPGSGATTGYPREGGQPSSVLPKPLREIGFDQNLDAQVPLDIPFRDEDGRTVPLGKYFGSKPIVLALVYYDCPMLCTQVLNGLTTALGVLSLDAGKEFDVVTVSFDPRETPALARAKKAKQLERYKRPTAMAGWHFLTGDQPSITRLTKAVGFRYVWDDNLKQFAHPTGVMVLTPQGRLARYLFGIEYGPRDLRFAIIDASSGKIGNAADALLLYCYHYDPENGRYGFVIMNVLRIAGIATILALAVFIIVMVRREKHPLPRPAERGTR